MPPEMIAVMVLGAFALMLLGSYAYQRNTADPADSGEAVSRRGDYTEEGFTPAPPCSHCSGSESEN